MSLLAIVNATLLELAQTRARLIARAAAQREQLALCADALSKPLLIAEQAGRFLRIFTSSPIVLAGLSTVLLKTPWRRVAKVPAWLWSGWKIFRTVRQFRA